MANLIKNTTDGTSVTGTIQTISVSELIPANSLAAGDIIEVINFVKKNVTTSGLNIRFYINTANNLTGATQLAIQSTGAGTAFGVITGRNYIIKSSTSTICYITTTSSNTPDAPASVAYSNLNIDWTVDQYFMVVLNHSSGASSNSYSTGLLVLKR